MVAATRKAVGAPDDTSFLYTGDEDDRPGCCNIDADIWVCGYSPSYLIELVKKRFAAGKRKHVDLYSWVEAS